MRWKTGSPYSGERPSRRVAHAQRALHRTGQTVELVDITNEPEEFVSCRASTLDSDRCASSADLDRHRGHGFDNPTDLPIAVIGSPARVAGDVQAEWQQPAPELK